MSTNTLEKKWKSLLHKVCYLKSELEERKEKLSKFESEIDAKIYEKDSDMSAAQGDTQVKKSDESLKATDITSASIKEAKESVVDSLPNNDNEVEHAQEPSRKIEVFKKLWTQIALMTHPDKNGGDSTLTSLYVSALKAWNDGELETLLDIAADLNVKIQDPSEEMVEALAERASKIEEEIKNHEASLMWAWGHTTQDKQARIVDELLRYKRKKRNGV